MESKLYFPLLIDTKSVSTSYLSLMLFVDNVIESTVSCSKLVSFAEKVGE